MKPERLIISGWGPYKKEEKIDFSLFNGRGLFLVTGATGAGKTTIFDAITYALFGNLSGTMREKNSVRSDFADADTATFVELYMEHGGKKYHIRRNPEYFRPRKRGGNALTKEKENAVLWLPDGKTVEGTREVNAKMQEILSLDYDQFKQITMIAQGEFTRMLTASPKEKTAIFREIFGTGIYERFAQILRTRSNALYGKVLEQKNKLEEDIRLLLVDAGGDECMQPLLSLTETDNWNYAAIEEELRHLGRTAEERENALQEVCTGLQKKNDKLTEEVTAKKLENDRIESLEQAKRTILLLGAQEAEMTQKRERLKRARAAQSLSDCRMRLQHAKKNRQEKEEQEKTLKRTLADRLAEQESLRFFSQNGEVLRQYLEICRQLEEVREQETADKIAFEDVFGRWEREKQLFLETETKRDEKRAAFQQADKVYRHAIVGVAARMLRPGEPCPVCGSKEHPNPAGEEPGLPSEEELSRLKDEWEKAEAGLKKVQERTASLKALSEEQEKRFLSAQKRRENMEEQEASARETFAREEALCEADFQMGTYSEKTAFLRKKEDRLSQLAGTISECEKQLAQITEEKAACEKELHDSTQEMEKGLLREGFSTEEECGLAMLGVRETEALEEELSTFEQKRAAALSVREHLEKTLKNTEKHDLTALTEKSDDVKRMLLERQGELKHAHAFCGEVKKTSLQFMEKRKKMAVAEEEYGYVRDLDNLASGNNPRRLVFEQYVLAGYFEMILRAANLRFYKMTGGRYEMSRVEEAGDGRVKDSLEIQVTDHYTGKMRSVKTLSGGECFKASLSLALGMSDVIQAANGGIRVDTLFIDEGFGALDSESLDQACETLLGLVEHDRLIGIISHVPELRERIDSQIVVDKTNSGSSIEIHV